MRISSQQIFNIARQSMATVNKDLVGTQEQMSSGKRVLTPADDPVAATKILQLTDDLYATDQYRKNIDIAQNNLDLEESILKNVNNLIQRIQELSVAAGNTATLTATEYKTMASEVNERMDELTNLLNTRNANGDYIFGGYKSTGKPFEGNVITGYSYNGDEGQQYIKVANDTVVATSDSGKTAFMDLRSANKTVNTHASASNTSIPPVQISVGQIYDQKEYDAFYPEDITITFNADSNVIPPGKNFTAIEKSTGRPIVENQRFVAGEEIRLKGVSVRLVGSPVSGTPAIPSTKLFGTEATLAFPVDFSGGSSQTFTITVGKHTETFVLDSNITSVTDLAATLNSGVNGNAGKLASLGITASSQGFTLPTGKTFTIANGSPQIDAVMGLTSQAGSTSRDGVLQKAGDRLFIDSTEKQGLLTTMARFHQGLDSFDGTPEGKKEIAGIVAATLDNLTNAQTGILNVVAKIGARINTLDSTRDLHLDTEFVNKQILSDLRDLDYAEAATRLSEQTLILQAAQQSFIRVSQLNLFSRL